jgi:predicted alpha/beta superfamily hydrolase
MMASILQPGIETLSMHSEILQQELELYIKLPWRYGRGDRVYPVLFALDANRAFHLYATMSLIYETPETSGDEIIIVGIGYKLDDQRIMGLAQWAAWRTRDFTPNQSMDTEVFWKTKLSALVGGDFRDVQSGRAAHFLKSLREEIIPFAETNYRISSDGRGLAGYSYGGLFTLYALFHAPELFTRYFAGSPTMREQLFEYEEKYASTNSDLTAKVFMTEGELESDLHDPIQRMVNLLRSRGYPGLDLQTHVFEGEGHSSAYAASVSKALRVLYNYSGD